MLLFANVIKPHDENFIDVHFSLNILKSFPRSTTLRIIL